MASTAGGMAIEDVAEESPEKILKVTRVAIICSLHSSITSNKAHPDFELIIAKHGKPVRVCDLAGTDRYY